MKRKRNRNTKSTKCMKFTNIQTNILGAMVVCVIHFTRSSIISKLLFTTDLSVVSTLVVLAVVLITYTVQATIQQNTLSHTRTVVRECFKGDEACRSMEKAKIRPLATPNPLNRSSPKLPCVITSWTALDMQNFVSIGSGVSVPQIRDFAVPLG